MFRMVLFVLALVSVSVTSLAAAVVPVVPTVAPHGQTGQADIMAQTEQSRLSVLVYPAGARVTLEKDLKIVNGTVSFELPRGASAQNLELTLRDRSVLSLESTPAPAPDSPAVAALRVRLNEAQLALAAIEGELASITTRLTLWDKLPVRFSQSADIEKTAALMASHITKLYETRAILKPKLDERQRDVERLQKTLHDADAVPADVEKVSARVFPATDGTVRANMVFTLNNCGWKPNYRIDAQPEQNTVKIVQMAEIFQGTGMEWKNAQLTLTSAMPNGRIAPPPMPSWVVRQAPEPRQSNAANEQDSMPSAALFAARPEAKAAPVAHSEQAVYSFWDLGKRTLPAGTPVRLTLDEMTWKAQFVRVLRPSVSKTAFLRAHIVLPQPVALPQGPAQFLVDGTSVGKTPFSFTGSEDDLFFGNDSRVTAQMLVDTQKSGRSGFIDKKQSRSWAWTIKVNNAHSTPADVLVEEPVPQLRDESIELKLNASPNPERIEQTYVWRLTVGAGQSATINHAVTITAPAEMRLVDGR